ncbi:hypothetical protein AB0873_09575 [Micromonospora sp. NPDC047707]|uniref:hypothetical protein n=1 Tax=Micromonospora sp. NPDC047707 TaxID=3154498 RepID=UPI0034516F26
MPRGHSRLTPEQRRIRAQIAANTRWSKEDPTAAAEKAQAGLLEKFRREVDPNNELPEAERERRAQAARRAHMQRLALASSKVRAAKRGGGDSAAA